MARVILRPTVSSDLGAVIGEPLPCRIKALTAELDGKILGIGGVAFPPGGTPIAFVQQSPEAKNYPVAFHRAGLMAMRMIRQSGIREVIATCDADSEVAIRWLKCLGFIPCDEQKIENKIVWIWQSSNA